MNLDLVPGEAARDVDHFEQGAPEPPPTLITPCTVGTVAVAMVAETASSTYVKSRHW
ncbi:hypothetical protein ACFYU9_17085 [Streptomyces sp. NPDC004327]|uniref:hypothetical protein n=1 Tax=Streptomyces sp. NPDC004327 TaxID=3364699 RepID=UPI0036B2F422